MLIGIDASRAVTPQRTGTENYSLHLIRALIRVGGRHRFRLYFRKEPLPGLFPRDDRVQWRCLPFARLWSHVRLSWEMACHPPDVLFVPSHVLPIVHPRRSVATVHDLGYLYYPEAHGRWARRYLDWSTRHNARASSIVIADSMATRADLVCHYGVPAQKVRVAYPAGATGLAVVRDAQRLQDVQARYGTGPLYYLYLGTLQPRKNLESLIQAFGDLLQRGVLDHHVKLVLAGKAGWLSAGILQAASRPELGGRVILPGYMPADDLAPLLSGALAFVLPSWHEGFGLPILEAMTCEVPVICSNVSSLPEVAGDAALLVDPGRVDDLAGAMLKLYRDPVLRRELVDRGKERIGHFSWERCAATVLAALEETGRMD